MNPVNKSNDKCLWDAFGCNVLMDVCVCVCEAFGMNVCTCRSFCGSFASLFAKWRYFLFDAYCSPIAIKTELKPHVQWRLPIISWLSTLQKT